MDFLKTLSVAASGLKAQSGRMRVIAENIANADSTGDRAGGDPYRRKIASFARHFDRKLEANVVELGRVDAEVASGDDDVRPVSAEAADDLVNDVVRRIVLPVDHRDVDRAPARPDAVREPLRLCIRERRARAGLDVDRRRRERFHRLFDRAPVRPRRRGDSEEEDEDCQRAPHGRIVPLYGSC